MWHFSRGLIALFWDNDVSIIDLAIIQLHAGISAYHYRMSEGAIFSGLNRSVFDPTSLCGATPGENRLLFKQGIFSSLNRSVFDDANPSPYTVGVKKGVDEALVRMISADKKEPEWMLQHRLKSLKIFQEKPMPTWGADLSKLDLENIIYYAKEGAIETDKWEEVPADIRRVYARLGIPEAERKMLAGVGAQYESEMIYHKLKEEWGKLGVVFLDMDNALEQYPDLVKEHFMQCVPPSDHKFAALHGAVWSGGTFLYIPKGVHVRDPLQAYFRMNA
ncbi:MAG: hypothetical protein AAB855_02395, partial [Patescibacteria group bacterium]